MITKVGMISLGCPKNRVDSEMMLGMLSEAGISIVNEPSDADALIVNTCGFIGPAKEESIDALLEYSEYKKNGSCRLLIVTGCMAQRYSNELLEEIPEIDIVLGTRDYDKLLESINKAKNGDKITFVSGLNEPLPEFPRILTTSQHSAYLKISDGCDNNCSYCVIPSLRGKYQSRSTNSIIDEAKHLVSNGTKEIIIIGQDITNYGQDLKDNSNLTGLLNELVKIEDLRWIRLMYLYPDRINEELLDTIANENKICDYLDIPIQHISSAILKRMNRRITGSDIRKLISKIRAKLPNVSLRTSIIVGFPGETREDFEELCAFVEESEFNHLGVFCYSPEEGTPAAEFEDQVEEEIKEERRAVLMRKQRSISKKLNAKRQNQNYEIIIDEIEKNNTYLGRTYKEAPIVDGQIHLLSSKTLNKGDIVTAKVVHSYDYDLLAEEHEFSK